MTLPQGMFDIFIRLCENIGVSGRPPFGASRWRATAGRSPFGVSLAFRPSILRPRAGTPLFFLGSPLFTQPHCLRTIGNYFVHFLCISYCPNVDLANETSSRVVLVCPFMVNFRSTKEVIFPFLFSVPSTFRAIIGSSRSCVLKPALFT